MRRTSTGVTSRWNWSPRTTRTERERLVDAARARRQQRGAGRQVERLAVPVKDAARPIEAHGLSLDGWLNREPPNLRLAVLEHAVSDRACDDLRAKAHAEHRPAVGDRVGNEGLLVHEPRIVGLVVHAHRSAHHDEQIDSPPSAAAGLRHTASSTPTSAPRACRAVRMLPGLSNGTCWRMCARTPLTSSPVAPAPSRRR